MTRERRTPAEIREAIERLFNPRGGPLMPRVPLPTAVGEGGQWTMKTPHGMDRGVRNAFIESVTAVAEEFDLTAGGSALQKASNVAASGKRRLLEALSGWAADQGVVARWSGARLLLTTSDRSIPVVLGPGYWTRYADADETTRANAIAAAADRIRTGFEAGLTSPYEGAIVVTTAALLKRVG